MNPTTQGYHVYTDNSAFSIQRFYNSSYARNVGAVGKNTYPYLQGLIWDSVGRGNTINIASNRPGGVSIIGDKANELDFYLTRYVTNVNWDKGLPDRLDDTTKTRLDLVYELKATKTTTVKDRQRLYEQVNDVFLVIQPDFFKNNQSPYDLANFQLT